MPDREPRIQSASTGKIERAQVRLTQEKIGEAENLLKTLGDHNSKEKFGPTEAEVLIGAGFADKVAQHLEKFVGIDENKLARTLISEGRNINVVFALKDFTNLDGDIAFQLLDALKGPERVACYLSRFKNLDHNKLAHQMIEQGDAAYEIERYLENFKELDSYVAQRLIEMTGGGSKVINLINNFVDHSRIACLLIEHGNTSYLWGNIERFGVLDSRVCIAAAEHKEAGLLASLFDTDWAPNMTAEELKQIGAAYPELQTTSEIISKDLRTIRSFDPYYIAVSLMSTDGDIGEKIETIREYPFVTDHLRINSRMAANLITKLPVFDTTALAHIETLHNLKEKDEGVINTVLAAKLREALPAHMLPPEVPIKTFNAPPKTLDMLDVQYRVSAIRNLRSFEKNPEILSALEHAGVATEEWLGYTEEKVFTLAEDKEIPLAARHIATPLNRLATETVVELARSFKQDFISSIPAETVVPAELDVKRETLVEKLRGAQQALTEATDPQKHLGIEKGIGALQQTLASYKAPAMRDALRSAVDALVVQANAIGQLQTKQKNLLAAPGTRSREEVQALKKLDNDIVKQVTTLVSRFGYTKRLIESASHATGISYDQFKTKELLEHFEEDATAIRVALSSFEKDKADPLAGREIRIGICNRNPYSSLYLGNYTGCCVSIEGPIHGEESPIADYLTDLGMQIVVAVDTTNKEKPLPVAAVWCYVGQDKNGKPVLQIDNIEANTGYTDPHKAQFTTEVRSYMEAYAARLKMPLFQGSENNDLEVAPLEDHDKFGGIYNRNGGYYLEADTGEYDEDEEDE